MSSVANKLVDRFVEAVHTGEHCGTSDTGPRRVAAISIRGIRLLYRHGLLAEAMERVGEIETPHPRAQERFLKAWIACGGLLREMTCNDAAFFAGLRVLLPPYEGPPVTLYRGQLAGDHLGVSWTSDFFTALKFTLYGWPGGIKDTPRRNGILIRATPHPSQIISAPCLHIPADGEYVVDPRWLKDYEIDEGDWTNTATRPAASRPATKETTQ